ncbi:MAG: PilZ domain-containing protein [Lacunisphaera sp.]
MKGVALFKHILDFKRTALARLRDKRKATRYSVGPAFPLKASIVLTDSDGMSRVSEEPPPPGIGRNWGGSLFNLSSEGLSLQLPPAAIARRGEQTFATLSLEGYELKLPCKVAHFRVQGGTAYCGLALDFPNQTLRKSYVQLLEAVALGSTLAPATGGRTSRARPGLRAERYKSARPALLTAWRDAGGRLVSFELVLRDHCLRGEAKRPALEVFSNQAEGEKTAWSAPGFAVSNGVENGEVRQLFRWVALNTSRSVPADLREMMHFFAHARSDWKAPAKPR